VITKARKNTKRSPLQRIIRQVSKETPSQKLVNSTPFPEFSGRACAEADPEVFFPKNEAKKLYEVSVKYCDKCPVYSECLKYAVDSGQEGIWAGTTTLMRKTL
jgi:WhiB family redox-sensing transcriptional regulator